MSGDALTHKINAVAILEPPWKVESDGVKGKRL